MVDGSRGVASALASLNQQRGKNVSDLGGAGSEMAIEAKACQMIAANSSILDMSSFSDDARGMTQGSCLSWQSSRRRNMYGPSC